MKDDIVKILPTKEWLAEPPDRRKWWVIHVRPRFEKKMAERCVMLGLSHYVPLRRETKVFQRRKVTVFKPLFPGYVFAACTVQARQELYKTNAISRFLEPHSQRQLLHELAQIRHALRVNPELMSSVGLERGTRVRITAGPFMGIEGVVSWIRGGARVRLNVEMIGQAVVVEVPRPYVEPMD